MGNTPVTWNAADFEWNFAPGTQETLGVLPYTWDDVTLLEDLLAQGASSEEIAYHVDQLEPEKKKRFIRLVCKVKGIETYSGQKTIKDDIKITAEDVKLVVEKVLDINLTIENIQI
jgi:hypothetical protein